LSADDGVGPFLNVTSAKTQETMEITIKVKINDDVLARMRSGEFVKGSLHYDQWTGEKRFKAYERISRRPGYVPESRTLAELDNGWLKETKTLIIRREAFQKRLGTARIMAQMDRGNKQAKEALIDKELGLIEFC